MELLDRLAERHITEAIARGELDDLPGAGEPIELDDDRLVPGELRAAYRLPKNAGHLPPELELRLGIRAVEELLAGIEEPAARGRAAARLSLLRARPGAARGRDLALQLEAGYGTRLAGCLGPAED